MTRWLVVALCCTGLVAAGCEKKDETPAGDEAAKVEKPAEKPEEAPAETEPEEKTAEAVAEAPAEDEAAADEKAEEKPAEGEPGKETAGAEAKPEEPAGPDPAAVEQCGRILDKCWESAKKGLALLQVEELDDLGESYRKSGKTFVDRCAVLDTKLRDCLEKSNNPLAGIRTCKVNEGKSGAEKLYAVDMKSHIKLFEPKPLPAKKAKALLRGMKGRWINNWKKAKIKITWKIDKQGHVKETKVAHGKTEKRELDISFEQTDRVKVTYPGGSSQPFFFFKPKRKIFYASSNLLYGAYPLKNRKNFILRDNWNYVVSKSGKCTAVAGTGETTKAKCRFARKKGKKIFSVKYQFADDFWNNGKPKIQERTYFQLGKMLASDSLVTSGKYVRK